MSALRHVVRRFDWVRHGTTLAYSTSLDADRLQDWLLDADVAPPGAKRDWVAWWDVVRDTLDAVQWAHVWRALDRVAFHDVVAVPNRPVLYVVLRVGWYYAAGRRGFPNLRERPIEYRIRDGATWYDDMVGSLTAEQRAAIWALLDSVRFYDVVEIDVDDAQG